MAILAYIRSLRDTGDASSFSSLPVFWAVTPAARTLEAITPARRDHLCAHPNALPFASRQGDVPGFQIEVARALARALGVSMYSTGWSTPISIAPPTAISCSTRSWTRVLAEVGSGCQNPIIAAGSRWPWAQIRRGIASPNRRGQRVGVQVGSLAPMVLGQRGIETTPFGFEDEMIEALAAGEIDAARSRRPRSAGST